MGRIRKIGGRLNERIAGHVKLYSEKDIVNKANDQVAQVGYSGGVELGAPERRSLGAITSDCVVQFLPGKDYETNANYGFDWFREGNSGQQREHAFKEIIGKYNNIGSNPLDTYKDSSNFEVDTTKVLTKLLFYNGIYNVWQDPWIDSLDNDLPIVGVINKMFNQKYCIPILTLLPGDTASLKVKIKINDVPSKIELRFEDENAESLIPLSFKEISEIKSGEYEVSQELEIGPIKELKHAYNITVYADDHLCGALRVLANDKRHIQEKEVYIVNVRTNPTQDNLPSHLSHYTIKEGKPKVGGMDKFVKSLQQGLVKLDIKKNYTVSCMDDEFLTFLSEWNGDHVVNLGDNQPTSDDFRKYLEQKFEDAYGEVDADALKLFFVPHNQKNLEVDANGNTSVKFSGAGYAFLDSTFGVMFAGHNEATIPHEMMHALGLYHTFEGKSTVPEFTYEYHKTNNIMDYGSPRFCTFGWQWRVLNDNIQF